jgi:hypothetical protein
MFMCRCWFGFGFPRTFSGKQKSPPPLVSGGLLKIGVGNYDFLPPPWVTTQATNERCIERVLVSGRFVVIVAWQFIEPRRL